MYLCYDTSCARGFPHIVKRIRNEERIIMSEIKDDKKEMTKKKKVTVFSILLIQAAVVVYTTSSIFSNLSSNYPVMSGKFILFIFLDLLSLGIYAIFWQQIIKRYDLSLAYANRATAIFWSMIWAALLFKEGITLANIIGVIVIFAGVMLVNTDAA